MKLKDVSVSDGNWTQISLSKLTGLKVKDIQGYISSPYDEPYFTVTRIILEDGQTLSVNGEHDLVYIEEEDERLNLDEETLGDLENQQDEEY